ncbi:fatty acid desaturase [Merismopedia glauca]|uniref:fatty acid desaturase n=1 Tax=Merismopedia glauca TaxID=292586 RepID=UPI0030DB1950
MASVIVVLWIASLKFFLLIDITQLTFLWVLLAILGRTSIQTGLFIVAHDAIHGAVLPRHRRWNNAIGRLAVTLYALLSYQKLSLNHWQHHKYPGQPSDPDFHDGIHDNILVWYLKFMKGYLDVRQTVIQFLGIGMMFLTLHFGCHIPISNLFLFWVLPIFLSSMQLFLFGTYLPHRSSSPRNSHHATSSNYPLFWSFLTCYHFGYHWEHHEYPFLPWYSLPSVRPNKRQRQPLENSSWKVTTRSIEGFSEVKVL